MKKNVFAAIAAMFVMAGYAQEKEAAASGTVTYGLKAGLNLATISGDVSDASMKAGAHFGVVAEIRISDRFSLQPELMYSMQGVKETVAEDLIGNGSLMRGEGKTKLDYLNVPVLAKIYMADGFALEVGPQVGFLIKGKVSYDLTYGGEHVSGSEDVTSSLKTVDFGIAAGLSYALPAGVFFQGRYALGLTNIYDGDGSTEGKNGVLQFSVGYKFP